MRFVLSLSLTAALAAPAVAGEAPAATERRLSPQQVEAVLAAAAGRREAAGQTIVSEPAEPAERRVHGQLGVSIGTGGYHGAFGSVFYPVGDDGVAAVAFDIEDWGERGFRR